MSNPFQSISGKRPLASEFDLTHNRKFSLRPGRAYPILCEEAIPSDVWKYDANCVMRMAPMIAPIMHMVDVCVHSFFYPTRLTQRRGMWEVFITGGKNGDGKDAQGNTVQIPYFKVNGNNVSASTHISIPGEMGPGSLADFLGFQYAIDAIDDASLVDINAQPFLAFWRIYCEYFIDQNVDTNWVEKYPDIFDSPGGNITAAIYAAMNADPQFEFFRVPRVRWEKDYFTSALPFAQRGEAVEAPLTGSGTVTYSDVSTVKTNSGNFPFDNTPLYGDDIDGSLQVPSSVGPTSGRIENIEEVNLTAGGFTISALRTAARLQEWLEKMATGGARYIEQIKAQFGVTSSDARLQRGEYLGGGKIPMHISEVIQTSDDGATPLAEMAGHGVTAGQVTTFRKFCEEHGYFVTIIYLRPKTAYQEGLRRVFWNRFDKLDFAWPSFARIGEQEVMLKELFFVANNSTDENIFGYQQRYAEYKYIPSTVHGEFRTTLSHWHWGRIFSNQFPTLSPEFVGCDPSDRIFNVLNPSTDMLYCIVTNRITARRPLPYYGEPHL